MRFNPDFWFCFDLSRGILEKLVRVANKTCWLIHDIEANLDKYVPRNLSTVAGGNY